MSEEHTNGLAVDYVVEHSELPVYFTFSTLDHSWPNIGETYTIREWQEPKEDRNFNELFDAILIGVKEYEYVEDINNVVLAYATGEASKPDALEKIEKYTEKQGDLFLYIFLRPDKAQQVVTGGLDSLIEGMGV
jgi:hypothetical protein